MTMINKLLVGSTGLAMLAGVASPAAAQYGAPQYGNPSQNVVGAIINSVLGGGRYGSYGQGVNRMAVDQCARAAEARVNGNAYGNGAYGQQGYGYQGNDPRYNQGQGYSQGGARVVAVTGVERRSSGLQVTGLIDSNRGYENRGYGSPNYQGQPYPNQGYGDPRYQQGYPQGVDPRYSQQGYPQGGDPRYGGWNNQGYANAGQVAELRFNCRVNRSGQITRLTINNNSQYRRAY